MTNARSKGLLNRTDMIESAGMSESSFDRLRIEPVERRGRETFYCVRDVVHAVLAREAMRSDILQALHKVNPAAARRAADQMARDAIR